MNIKQVTLFAAMSFCLLAAGMATLPFIISTQNIKRHLDSSIMQMADRISYKGEPELSFNPYLGVKIKNAIFTDEKQKKAFNFLQIECLQFRIQLLPLVFGQIKFADFRLIRPKFNFPVNEKDAINWEIIKRKVSNLLESGQRKGTDNYDSNIQSVILDNAEWGDKPNQFEIVDGIIEARISDDGTVFRISNLDATLFLPDISSPWNIDGQAVWRGEIFEFSSTIENPLALSTSDKSGLKFDLSSPTLTVSFDGQAIMVSDIHLQGNASISTPSLARLSELLLNDYSSLIFPVGSFGLRGSISANTQEIHFTQADIVLDNNVATGNLQFYGFDKKTPKISATLAFTSVDLTPLAKFTSREVMQAMVPENKTFTGFPFDFDVRFSSRSYKINKNSFGSLAATAILDRDKWLFDIGEADFFGGKIVAAIASRTIDDVNSIKLKGTIRNFSVSDIMPDLYSGKILVTGKANMDFNLETSVRLVSSIYKGINGLSGNISITLGEGEIKGVDLAKFLSTLNQNKRFVIINELEGTTSFNSLSLDLLAYRGPGWITRGTIQGQEDEFRFSGTADLSNGGIAIYMDIGKTGKDDDSSQPGHIFIGGTVNNPLLMRSPSSLDKPRE